MKRFFIVSLCLLALFLVVRWQSPVLINKTLEHHLAKHDVELDCLQWQLDGFQQLKVQQLCIRWQDIAVNAHSLDIALMQAAFWQNNFDWKNLVPRIKAKKLELMLPASVDLATLSVTSASTTTSGIPVFWLPDVAIERIEVFSPSIEKNMVFSFNLSQEKQQRTLVLNSLDVEESADLSVSQLNQDLRLEWQVSLPWLYDILVTWLPLFTPVPEPFESISISSGLLSGQLALNAATPERFQSSHKIANFNGQFTHGTLSEPFYLVSQEQFQLNRQDEVVKVTVEESGTTSLNNFDAIAGTMLKNFQWQGITVNLQSIDLPDQSPLDIDLPSSINIQLSDTDADVIGIQADSLKASNDRQQMQFRELSWRAETGEVNTRMHLKNLLFLEREDVLEKVRKNNQISTELKGQIKTDLVTSSIALEQFSVSEVGLGSASHSVLDLPKNVSWFATELTGSGDLHWQDQSWFFNGDYRANLTNLQAAPLTFFEATSQGKFALSDKKFDSIQTLTLDQNISLHISTVGSLQQLTIDAILPDAQLDSLNDLIQQFEPNASLTEGVVSAAITAKINESKLEKAELDLIIENAAGSWLDYQFSELKTAIPLSIDQSFQISAQPKQLQIEKLQVGTAITNIEGRFLINGIINRPQFQLQQLSGDVFHGSFNLEQLNYPLTLNSEALLRIEGFNLDEMVNLFGDQGIDITGSVSGDIPLSFSEGLVSVEQAIVKADTEGRLSIQNNAAFQDLKNSQGTLGIALTLLEELNYTTLQSEVQLEPDGWMTLGVNITGVNPQQEQPINFNPTLTTNLFTGLKALRAGQNVADTIEQQLQN